MRDRGLTVLALSTVLALAGRPASAGDEHKPGASPKEVPSGEVRRSGPSPERIKDLQTTLAKRKKRRSRSKQIAIGSSAALNAQLSAWYSQSTGIGLSDPMCGSEAACVDCGSLFTPQNILALPPGLDLSHGVRLTLPSPLIS